MKAPLIHSDLAVAVVGDLASKSHKESLEPRMTSASTHGRH